LIRKATESDGPRIAEIQCYGWRFAYKDIISEKYLYTKVSVYDRAKRFYDKKEYEDRFFYVFEDDELVHGFMRMRACRNEDKKEAFELCVLYVEPLLQGRGTGTALLQFCEQTAIAQGINEIVLWVLRENKKARGFYEKNGYAPDGKTQYLENIGATEIRYVKSVH
jgi:diamine N-acetyltransferase